MLLPAGEKKEFQELLLRSSYRPTIARIPPRRLALPDDLDDLPAAEAQISGFLRSVFKPHTKLPKSRGYELFFFTSPPDLQPVSSATGSP